MKKVDTIIIGQGIAGSLLAIELIEKGVDFLVLDNHLKHSSSTIAAGLYNPVVFRKPTLGFNVQNVLPFALHRYKELEQKLACSFLHERPYAKFFENYATINNWEATAADEKFRSYIKLPLKKESIEGVKNDLPYAETKYTGNVDLPLFLNAVGTLLKEQKALIQGNVKQIEYNQKITILLSNDDELQCNKLILARGHQERHSKEFAHATVGATKGDVLTIECPGLKSEYILSKGFFVMPIGNDKYKLGATYNWDDKSYEPSEEAKQELMKRFESLVDLPYKVIDHETGLRPGAKDRRPLLGAHPEIDNLYIFNGLGSKGVLLAPLYANQLANHIFEGKPIDKEVNVERMKKYYGNSED